MRNASLHEPVSESAPSGPDLDETGDEAYAEYMMLAGARLPDRFFSNEGNGSNRDVPFDRSRVDIGAETEAIDALLERTRDVRLLVLEARFQALSGSFRGFADSLQDLAEMVDRFWDSVHPAPEGDDFTRRTNAIEELENQVHVILPLTFAPIVGSGGGATSYRSYMLATERARPREEEPVPTLDAVTEGLSSPRNTEQATIAATAVSDAVAALNAIQAMFRSKAGHASVPSFERQLKLLGDITALLAELRPDLVPSGAAEAAGPGADIAGPAPVQAAPTVGAVRIATQSEASSALRAIEDYFQTREPSAPALILVHQARMLFGKPLVSVLEALLPDAATVIALRFDGAGQFDIGFDQMRSVTDDAAVAGAAASEAEQAPDGTVFSAESRSDATALMLGVEGFYRLVEPSSPIPLLLSKARALLNKDFSALLGELLPPSDS
ncbi:ImpA family type VI secretion system protein [Devosia sp. Root635]|uniref:type VI secretion system protein TssA n=1 Tax=Devosia sp. Root635 TaxID=1736575 RepID=UPI0006F35443|nr:type VI secretion system ImpA family N-terminal domain-containing protein [Devosia sp. Root635]KRA53075.1 hypothetical protein ASD80_13875 [Devosia sp. Root635]